MTATILGLLALGIISACITVLIARTMFTTCRRRDLQAHGSTPAMFRAVDPYIAGLVEKLYLPSNAENSCLEEGDHV